jgi:hypothetical protein
MHDQLDLLLFENVLNGLRIAKVGRIEGNLTGDSPAMTKDKIVQDYGTVTCCDQLADAMAADITGASDYEYVHKIIRVE